MRLLFDENLSRRLVRLLQADYPESAHVAPCGLATELDAAVFRYAAVQGFVLVTSNRDFAELSALHGAPPKVVWLRLRNASTQRVAQSLVQNLPALQALVEDPSKALLILHDR